MKHDLLDNDTRMRSRFEMTLWRRCLWHDRWIVVAFIAIVAWVANYLHFASFGVYEDDWFFVAFPFFVGPKTWIVGSLWEMFARLKAQGRPLQMISLYTSSAVGALTNSIAVEYLIAYLLFTGSALLAYAVFRRRFCCLAAILAALLFVLTPLYTLHQFLNQQFTNDPGFILVFSAMLLYVSGRRRWAYVLATLSIFCYESIFFLFLGAPLLKRGRVFRGRRREWFVHLGTGAALAGCYLLTRMALGEERVGTLPHGLSLLWPVLYSWIFSTFASFLTYVHAAVRAREATLEAWLYAIPFFLVVAVGLFHAGRRRALIGRSRRTVKVPAVVTSAAVGFVFLLLGYLTSYFFFTASHQLYISDISGRDTRVSCAASFGSSILFAVFLSAWLRMTRTRAARLLACAGISGFLTILFLYSFVLQNDYVEDWADQREQARQMLALTPDVDLDSAIIMKLRKPEAPGVFGHRRGIGLGRFMYEQQFGWMCAPGRPWPRLFFVQSDQWQKHLKQDADGFMAWTEPIFGGRWGPATGRFRPGRFIVLEEQDPGFIVRSSQPISVNGVQIVQLPPAGNQKAPLWTLISRNYLAQKLFPGIVWKSATVFGDRNPRLISPPDGAVLTSSPVTFSWTPVNGAINYWVGVGTGPGRNDILGTFSEGKTSITVDLSGHLTGETVHLQILAAFPDYHLVPGSGVKFAFGTRATAPGQGENRIP